MDKQSDAYAALIVKYFEDDLSDEQWNKLDRGLSEDETVRESFVDACRIVCLLNECLCINRYGAAVQQKADGGGVVMHEGYAAAAGVSEVKKHKQSGRHSARQRWSIGVSLAALVAIACMIWFLDLFTVGSDSFHSKSSTFHSQAMDVPIATVASITGSLLIDGKLAIPGADCAAGPITLESGLAELALFNGVVVQLRDKTQLIIRDSTDIALIRGTISVAVPHGVADYTVTTSHLRLIDLGTEFAVHVDDAGIAHVEVFSGRVEATSLDDSNAVPTILQPFEPIRVAPGSGTLDPEPVHKSYFADMRVMKAGWPGMNLTGRPNDVIRLDATDPQPYSDQDGNNQQPSRFELDMGVLRLSGNAWKAIPIDYTVSESTILEFEFRSDVVAELHGVALDDDNNVITGGRRLFAVAGRETSNGLAWYEFQGSTPSQWQVYRIPVGQYYTGMMRQLVFFADDDEHGQATSWFRNVRLYEDVDSASPSRHTRVKVPSKEVSK